MRIKIITHNVFWFQGHPFQGDRPEAANKEVLQQLCSLYDEKEATILFLQEIQSAVVANQVAQATGMNVVYTPGNIYPQYGNLIATQLDTLTRCQPTTPLALERSLTVAELPLSSGSLKLACVHLTSGRQSGAIGAGAARLKEIEGFLTAYGESVDVIAGDFNENPDQGVANLLSEHGFMDCATLFGTETIPTLVHRPRRLDLIRVNKRLQHNVVDYGVMHDEMTIHNHQSITALSDHCPVWITLDT